MQNFISLNSGELKHPTTGQSTNPQRLLMEYTRPFIKALFFRAGHPVFVARKVGGYIDHWNSEDDPQWQVTAMMRYRSRRDLIELAANQRFTDIHIFKKLALEKTLSFPTQMTLSVFLKPTVSVPLSLLLLASLTQNILHIVV